MLKSTFKKSYDNPVLHNKELFANFYQDLRAERFARLAQPDTENLYAPANPSPTCEEMKAWNASIPPVIQKWVQQVMDEYFFDIVSQLGICHSLWGAEKRLYEYQGYRWYTPNETNPNVIFD